MRQTSQGWRIMNEKERKGTRRDYIWKRGNATLSSQSINFYLNFSWVTFKTSLKDTWNWMNELLCTMQMAAGVIFGIIEFPGPRVTVSCSMPSLTLTPEIITSEVWAPLHPWFLLGFQGDIQLDKKFVYFANHFECFHCSFYYLKMQAAWLACA